MKTFPIVALLLFQSLQFFGQAITGKVLDASTNEQLIYVSIGVIGTSVSDMKKTYKVD